MDNLLDNEFLQKVNKIEVKTGYFSDTIIKKLLKLAEENKLNFRKNTGNGERMSYDNTKKSELSTYKFANFNHNAKVVTKSLLKKEMKHHANEIYFLSVKTGEELFSWKTAEKSFFTVFAVALTKSSVIVEDTNYDLNPGDAILFPLNKMHSVPKSDSDQMFFNHIILGGY